MPSAVDGSQETEEFQQAEAHFLRRSSQEDKFYFEVSRLLAAERAKKASRTKALSTRRQATQRFTALHRLSVLREDRRLVDIIGIRGIMNSEAADPGHCPLADQGRPLLRAMERMTKQNTQKGALSLLILAAAFFLSPLSFSRQEDISTYRERLARLQQEKKNLQKRINELDRRKTSILAQLDRIGLEKKLLQQELAEYNLQLNRANGELASVQAQILVLEERVKKEKESVAKILVTLYKFGNIGYLDFLFRAKDISDLMSENRHLTFLAKYQEEIILSFIQTLSDMEAAKEKLELKKEEVAGFVRQAKLKKSELNSQENKNRNFIRQINQDQATHLQTLEELKSRAEQLQALIDRLLNEKSPLPFTIIPLFEKKGELPWPVPGKIVTSFGLERHPRFNTVTENQGIEIAAEENALVRAIHPGRVAYADFFQGFYGNLVIIDHGLSYYSMYGHCSELVVRKGDVVEAGQTIAIAGDTGSLKGTAVYFQINNKTAPEDPLQWLKRR